MRKQLTVTNIKTGHQSFICADIEDLKMMQRWYNNFKENGCKKYKTNIS